MTVNGKIRLRRKRLSDAENDYRWQTDAELGRLDASNLLDVSYPEYLLEYATELNLNPSRFDCWFAVETLDGCHIGNCGYYNLNLVKKEAELGIMIGEQDYWDQGYGADTVKALLDFLFRETKLERIYLKTLEWNSRAQKCFQKCGFVYCGKMVKDGYNFILMEVARKEWTERHTSNAVLPAGS